MGKYLSLWGFTPQKPLRKVYEQRPSEVKRWLKESYPEIKDQAKRENAEVYWGDETGSRNDCQHEDCYAPRGKTLVIRLNTNRVSTNMILAITNQRTVLIQVFEGTMNAQKLIKFYKRLIKSAKREVYLILDNLCVHHARIFKSWLEEHKDKIVVYYLLAYSPELNPDEYLNCDLKACVHSGKPARNKDQLKGKVLSYLKILQKKHRCIQYAA